MITPFNYVLLLDTYEVGVVTPNIKDNLYEVDIYGIENTEIYHCCRRLCKEEELAIINETKFEKLLLGGK